MALTPIAQRARSEIQFSYAGALTALAKSTRSTRRRAAAVLTEVFCSLDTAGSTNTVISVRRNGVEVATVAIAAGAFTGTTGPLTIALALGDYLQLVITTAGTGAADLEGQALIEAA